MLRTLEGHTGEVRSVSVTPDGRRAVSGSGDPYAAGVGPAKRACLRTLEGHSNTVAGVSVTPDGKRAVSGSWDQTLRVWDLESGACLRTLEHTGLVGEGVTPDCRRAVSGSWDNTVRVWDLETGICLVIAVTPGLTMAMALSPMLGRVIAGTSTGEILQFDLRGIPLTASSQVT